MFVKPTILSITAYVETPEIAIIVLGELEARFGESVTKWTYSPYPTTKGEYVFQGVVKQQQETMRKLVGLVKMIPDLSGDVQPHISITEVNFINSYFTDMETFLLNSLVNLTKETKANILQGITQIRALKNVGEQQEARLQALHDEVKGIRIFNETFVLPLQQVIANFAEQSGLEYNDVFPNSFHKVH